MLLLLSGKANAGLLGSRMFSPAISTGFQFKSNGDIAYFFCCPVKNETTLLNSLKTTFGTARLPQSPDINGSFKKNEILYTAYCGFLQLGGSLDVGYCLNGAKDFSLGELELSSKLVIKAAACLQISSQLTGSFRIIATHSQTTGWSRVVVEKNHGSSFDLALGVTLEIIMSTDETQQGGMALIEAILGTKPSQVLESILSYAGKKPAEWKDSLDGCIKEVIEKYTGEVFDRIPEKQLTEILGIAQKIQEQIDSVDEDIISIYEKFLNRINFPENFSKLKQVVDEADPEVLKDKLLQLISSPELRFLVEQLAEVSIGKLITEYDSCIQTLKNRLNQLDQLLNGQMKDEIRKFVATVLEELDLNKISAELAKYDSPEKLKTQATHAAQGLAERLTGKTFDRIFSDPTVNELVVGVNRFAATFRDTLTYVGDMIKKATNSRGRCSLSLDYQKAKESERLLDVEIYTGTKEEPEKSGLDLYHQATMGNFGKVLCNENSGIIRINAATFTDTLKEKSTVDIHIFGWDYKKVSEILVNLDRSLSVGDTGFVTIYKMSAEVDKQIAEGRRTMELNYMFQVSGALAGAFSSDDAFRERVVAASEFMKNLDNSMMFEIDDSIASFDELDSYIQIGVETSLLTLEEKDNLIKSLQKVKLDSQCEGDLGKVRVNYSFSFDGAALADALKTDFSKKLNRPWLSSNIEALEWIYVERLKTCYRPGKKRGNASGISDDTIYSLYEGGIFSAFRQNPQYLDYCWKGIKNITFSSKNGTHTVPANYHEVEWCRVLYLNNVSFAKMIESLRNIFVSGNSSTVNALEEMLTSFVKKFSDIGAGDNRLVSLPFLVLDEMIRLTIGSTNPQRKAFLEVTLYDPSSGKEFLYIPISS